MGLAKHLFALFVILACGVAQAQTGRAFPTVEAIVGSSEQVYSGWIESAPPSVNEPKTNPHRFHLVVHVVDTFKGPVKQRIEIDMTSFLPQSVFRQFCERREMFLWLSPPTDRQVEYDLTSKMGSEGGRPDFLWFRLYEYGSMTRYMDYDSNIFTSDLRVISTWKDLRKEIQRFLKRHSEIVETVSVTLPDSIIEMCGDPNAFGVVIAAKTPEFLKVAKELAEDPSRVIDRAVSNSKRVWKKPVLSPADIRVTKQRAEEVLRRF